ncbi:MAG TPA: hypothetical protein VMR45_02250 [Patescibacteria group bacterium]|nr:hypothetical protein [Patescibacteria group bacterium]
MTKESSIETIELCDGTIYGIGQYVVAVYDAVETALKSTGNPDAIDAKNGILEAANLIELARLYVVEAGQADL